MLELLEAQMGLKVAELQHYSHGVSNGAGCGVGHGAGSVREELLQEQCRLRRLKERRWQLLVLLERNCRGCVQVGAMGSTGAMGILGQWGNVGYEGIGVNGDRKSVV